MSIHGCSTAFPFSTSSRLLKTSALLSPFQFQNVSSMHFSLERRHSRQRTHPRIWALLTSDSSLDSFRGATISPFRARRGNRYSTPRYSMCRRRFLIRETHSRPDESTICTIRTMARGPAQQSACHVMEAGPRPIGNDPALRLRATTRRIDTAGRSVFVILLANLIRRRHSHRRIQRWPNENWCSPSIFASARGSTAR